MDPPIKKIEKGPDPTGIPAAGSGPFGLNVSSAGGA